ncbi:MULTISPECIES: hypothetical protein [Paenibacillus]|jgi:hypothetical protein|uniref:Bacterial Pleckstrin homology domain-containing protein n=2 Tax=Paenibacillus lactis TaxID=228574 RepID=G4HAQ5_9BACL|nr:hypothetical protein [Paenibacillus lactis]EHB67014.1 hypothetical protein PaelaDRAFT_1238 [Paenibacillus lactis 154]MBP1895688.1 hypothetical protein [Paenibacillus lactis]MCM3496822.1 hypothetical protein [Paenibacillus lactis]GIO93644.1 hypothetical protein J31TS3_48710 [Paenibacillus lactis]HAG00544.1 hypothetical protein [Paenibacillus lactis]
MNWIAVQPYYKINRVVDGIEQRTEEQRRKMYLYEDRIVTKYRVFPLGQVFDLSYRTIGGEGGFLYLHTQQGVYSYTVKEDPRTFIEAFKQL